MFKKILVFAVSLWLLLSAFSVSAAEPTAKTYIDGPKSVTEGTEFEVTFYAEGEYISAIMGKFRFDHKKLEYIKVTKNSDIGGKWAITPPQVIDGAFQFACADESKKGKTLIKEKTAVMTVTFKALVDTNNMDFTITEQKAYCVTNALDGSGKLVAVADTSYMGTVHTNDSSQPEIVSSESDVSSEETVNEETNQDPDNNFLKSLSIKNVDLEPKFDPNVKEYEIFVKEDVTNLEVEAKAQSSKATVEISGEQLDFTTQYGKNVTKITVTSESGLKRTYYIDTVKIEVPQEEKSDADQISWVWLAIIGGAASVVTLIVFICVRKNNKRSAKH